VHRTMTRVIVFDASALIAYLKGEPGGDAVATLLKDNTLMRFAHGLNVAEVYYNARKASDDTTAQAAIGMLVTDGVSIRNDLDDRLWREAATWKAKLLPTPSFADCFCLAFALRVSGEVITCDHSHFDGIANDSICPVRFIR